MIRNFLLPALLAAAYFYSIYFAAPILFYIIYINFQKKSQNAKWNAVIQKKKESLKSEKTRLLSLLKDFSINPEVESKLLTSDATDIKEMLDSNKVTSEQLVNFYTKRTLTVGEEYNFVVCFMYESAIKKAKEIDKQREKLSIAERKKLNSLHGIPVSLKEVILYENTDSTLGQAKYCFKPSEATCYQVLFFEKYGLIPFIKTNVPQCLLVNESVNRIFGYTLNPYNKGRTTGGSSGGEAAALLSRCSPFGIGSDAGGSIRIPACFCGLTGLKPTSRRTHFRKHSRLIKSHCFVYGNYGPMAHSTRDLAAFMQLQQHEDMTKENLAVPPIPWDNEKYIKNNGKLRIGKLTSNILLKPAPASQRALNETCEKLKKLGHEVVEFDFDFSKLSNIYISFGATILRDRSSDVDGENLIKELALFKLSQRVPDKLKKLVALVLSPLAKFKTFSQILTFTSITSIGEFWTFVNAQKEIEHQFFKKWDELKLDALLTVGTGTTAFQHGGSKELNLTAAYTFIFNLIDCPCAVVPIDHVTKNDEKYECGSDMYEKAIQRSTKGSEGLPCGVQIVALPFQDEKCLNISTLIEKSVNFKSKYVVKKQ